VDDDVAELQVVGRSWPGAGVTAEPIAPVSAAAVAGSAPPVAGSVETSALAVEFATEDAESELEAPQIEPAGPAD
jgi:hypothetical protein